MKTACMTCKTSSENRLDKPTGRLICVNCGAEIIISDDTRNALAKRGLFMAAPIQPPQQQRPQPQQWLPQGQHAQQPQHQQFPPQQAQQPPRNYPTVSPRVQDPSSARAAAEARIRKMHAAGQAAAGAGKVTDETVRTGIVQFSKVSREEAAARKAHDRAALNEAINSNPSIGIERINERQRNITKETFREAGVDIDRIDFNFNPDEN